MYITAALHQLATTRPQPSQLGERGGLTRAWDAHAEDMERVVGVALTTADASVLFKLLGPVRRVARRQIERARPAGRGARLPL